MSGLGFGIDGGGTRSRLCVFDWDTGEERCRLVGESTNLYSVGTQAALEHVGALLGSAGFPLAAYRGGCIGSAGLSRPAERRIFASYFAEQMPGCPVYLCNDGETLLVGALGSRSGYALISGTGSIALGRDEGGRVVRAGGLGYMLGDEGSALWIGWQAIMRALRAREGRDLQTGLLEPLVRFFGLSGPDDFVAMLHQRFDKREIASAAQLVLQAAQSDPLAGDIARRAARELALLVKSVREQLPLPAMRVALSGGVLEKSAFMREALDSELRGCYPQVQIVLARGEAVVGACMLARGQADACACI